MEQRLAAAALAFQTWRRSRFFDRAVVLGRAAEFLRHDANNHARLIANEMGKPICQARAEVEKCATVLDFYCEHAQGFLAQKQVETEARRSFVRCDPLGPVLAVMPWNFPYWQVFRFAAPALMAGNVGLLKHSSNVPGCALAIERLLLKAGLPHGVFQTLLISGSQAETLIADPRIAAVTLTGSETAGMAVGSAAGRALKKSVLELGGSDPFIVLGDADLDAAARTAALSRTINSGQSCIAAKRFIAVDSVHDEFVRKLEAALASLKMGDPLEEATDIGPLARADLRQELHDQVERTVAEGARLELGGQIPQGPGNFYPPTLLTRVEPHMAAAREETFGPVAPVLRVKDEAEAIDVANATRFGLGATIFSASGSRAAELASHLDVGTVFVNGMVKSDPRLPFGGVKLSGYGRELGEEGLKEFVNIKSVWMG
jgi:succinate-semialdehyde dehydrogenase/glutarate-semialdehyde dehydrogenase